MYTNPLKNTGPLRHLNRLNNPNRLPNPTTNQATPNLYQENYIYASDLPNERRLLRTLERFKKNSTNTQLWIQSLSYSRTC